VSPFGYLVRWPLLTVIRHGCFLGVSKPHIDCQLAVALDSKSSVLILRIAACMGFGG
jgi:hypothetical protein